MNINLGEHFMHSQGEWAPENTKFVEKIPLPNGTFRYIYEDDLEVQKNAKKSSTNSKSKEKDKEDDPDAPTDDDKVALLAGKVPNDWLEKLKAHTDKIIQQHAEMFKDAKTVIFHLLKPENKQAFRNTLQALTGADPTKLSDQLVDKMRRQLARQYGVVQAEPEKLQEETEKKTESKSSSTSSSSSGSSSSTKKADDMDYQKIYKTPQKRKKK